MDDPTPSHSFIVRVWLEPTGKPGKAMHWRGHITHVPSGQRRYFQKIDEMADFVQLYTERWGENQTLTQRVKQWLRRHRVRDT